MGVRVSGGIQWCPSVLCVRRGLIRSRVLRAAMAGMWVGLGRWRWRWGLGRRSSVVSVPGWLGLMSRRRSLRWVSRTRRRARRSPRPRVPVRAPRPAQRPPTMIRRVGCRHRNHRAIVRTSTIPISNWSKTSTTSRQRQTARLRLTSAPRTMR